jgi:uncharacterized membrane protein
MTADAAQRPRSPKLERALCILACVGVLWSAAIPRLAAESEPGEGSLFCAPGTCDRVLTGPYATLAGVKLHWWGLAGFALLGIAVVTRAPGNWERRIDWIIRLGIGTGLGLEAYLIHVQMNILTVWCTLCLVAAALVIASTVLWFLIDPKRESLAIAAPLAMLAAAISLISFAESELNDSWLDNVENTVKDTGATAQAKADLTIRVESSKTEKNGPAELDELPPLVLHGFHDYTCDHCAAVDHTLFKDFRERWIAAGRGRIRHHDYPDTAFIGTRYPFDEHPIVELAIGGAPGAGTLTAPGQADWFRFRVADAGRYAVATAGRTDVVMSLHGPENQSALLAFDDDSGPGLNARIVHDLAPATYYVQVRHWGPTGTGQYEVAVEPV